MKGGGRRGRRGGRRQRRREDQQRALRAAENGGGTQPAASAPEATPILAVDVTEPAAQPIRSHPAEPPHPQPHPPPLSARELVARLEARRLQAAHEADHGGQRTHSNGADPQVATAAAIPDVSGGAPREAEMDVDAASARPAGADLASPPIPLPEERVPAPPRAFLARGVEWLARVAGQGTGGTGRVAIARVEAIRFARATEPERVAAEVLVPCAKLDELYDDELAELLERGLRAGKGHD